MFPAPPVPYDFLGIDPSVSYIMSMKVTKRSLIPAIVSVCIALALVIKFGPGVLYSRISPDSSKEECLELAQKYMEGEDPQSAIYPLLLAIEKDQNDHLAHLLLAKVYFRSDILHLAERECSTSLKLNPENREGIELLCRIKFEQGRSSWQREDLAGALSDFDFVLERSEDQKLIDSMAHLTGGRLKMTRLTNDLFCDDAPSFSPDGRRIVYHSDTSYFLEDYGLDKVEVRTSRIFAMDRDGGNKTCLSPPEEEEPSEQFARFSHDGRFLVYEKENSPPRASDTVFNTDRDIFMRDLDGGQVRRLTCDQTYDGLPSFSADDGQIVFVSDRPGGGGICTLNLKTGEIENVSLKESWDEKIGLLRHYRRMIMPYCPSFSPDGKKILMHAGWDRRGVHVFDIETQSWERLTDRNMDCYFPSFSMDGKRIVFISGRPEREDLYLISADGANQRRLTYDGGSKRYPSFSSDGKSIVFAGKRKGEPDNYFEIYLLELEESISREKLKERLKELKRASSESALAGSSPND